MGHKTLWTSRSLRSFTYIGLVVAVLFPGVLSAGQIYGSVVVANVGLANAAIEINCGGVVTRGSTTADGSYRINVPQQGQCTLAVLAYTDRPSAIIFSNPNPAAYNFAVARSPNGRYELHRR